MANSSCASQKKMKVFVTDEHDTRDRILQRILAEKCRKGSEDPFYVVSVDDVVGKYNDWKASLPRVLPFYAVKCNSNPTIVRTLISLGCGVDIASKRELQRALALRIPKHKVVYSNTCKAPSNLLYAKQKGINLTVFDSEDELLKIKEFHPKAHLMVRLRHDDPKSTIPMGKRFGVSHETALILLHQSWDLGLQVVGVAFHVGCGSTDSGVYVAAIGAAKKLFRYASERGKPFTTLDIGGGYSGSMGNLTIPFHEFCSPIREALDHHFPEEDGIRIIAEPGQFLVATVQSLFATVIGRKQGEPGERIYTLSDGFHGSCRDMVTFGLVPTLRIFQMDGAPKLAEELHRSTLCGPTCDPMDHVASNVMLPALKNGQWIEFLRMGAYTNELFCNFNGFPKPQVMVFVSNHHASLLSDESLPDHS